MSILSDEQQSVVDYATVPLCVTACAGSGKTRTAVHRLLKVRRVISDRHCVVALLSFSNVAVDTFRRDYYALTRGTKKGGLGFLSRHVEIDTVDAFITANVLRPHSYRTMKADRSAFLVNGSEPFLKGFKVFDGKRPHPTADLRAMLSEGAFRFEAGPTYAPVPIASSVAVSAIEKLGRVGAYSHDLGRYWACRTLVEQPKILQALARRYTHILIDEAQDIGPEHQAILELMIAGGLSLSLIGDSNQGIYEFSGADGEFLKSYGGESGVVEKSLSRNYRSVLSIVDVANKLSKRSDVADREAPPYLSGAFYLSYKSADQQALQAAFINLIEDANINPRDAAIVCRSSKRAAEWGGGGDAPGQGVVKALARAAIHRDKSHQYDEAFRQVVYAILGLLDDKHKDLGQKLFQSVPDPEFRKLKRELWKFVRSSEEGLPPGTFSASKEWHPLLVTRVKSLLDKLANEYSLVVGGNIGHKLKKTGLADTPLLDIPDLATPELPRVRVCTVHQVKGESIDAVMYIADKSHVSALLDGTETELGRIGYVAVTRARNLFVLAVPENCLADFEAKLGAYGFKKAGGLSVGVSKASGE